MRNLLNVAAHMVGQASRLGISSHDQSCTKRARLDTNSSSSSSKAIVALLSGRWAAQVYVNHRWILLGIYESKKEAVRAYERATMKVWIDIVAGNLQSTSTQEINIQKQASVEAAIVETNDDTHSSGSFKAPQVNGNQKCKCKGGNVLALSNTQKQASIESAIARNTDNTNLSSPVNTLQMHPNQNFECTRLFEKVLTPSDTSNLNRFLVPKLHASYFPCVCGDNDAELTFYDRSMALWTFRYCYWKSSHSRVFSKGWSKFLHDKSLRSKDKVVFYECKRLEATNVVRTYFMIVVEYYVNGVWVEEVDANVRGENDDDKDNGVETSSVRCDMASKAVKQLGSNESEKAAPATTGFKLFGVNIA